MVLHITNKVQQSLGIPELPPAKETDPKGFLIDWNMNMFNIKNKWFFIFTESKTFYSIIDIAKPINGSKACGEYLIELAYQAIRKETGNGINLESEIFSIRKTLNNAPRKIMLDKIYHAQGCKDKNDISIFDSINTFPEKLLNWKSSEESFIENIHEITNMFSKSVILV